MKAVNCDVMLKASGKGNIADSGKQLIFMSHGNLNMRKCSFSVCSLHDSDAERGPGVAQNRPVVCSNRTGDNSWQVEHGEQVNLDKCRKIHATGSGPSGLGMMQPEGRPQQGKLKT